MSWRHTGARRHASTARQHGLLVWTLALTAGALSFVVSYPYFKVVEILGDISTVDYSQYRTADERPKPPPVDSAEGQWVNILVMGSDTRVGDNVGIGGEADGMRNDTTILVHISADRTRVEFLSIPRDSMVELSDCTLSDGTVVRGRETLFNNAFANGGRNGNVGDAAACVITNVEDLTGIYIQEFVVIDFVGVQDVVNVIGPIPMCVPYAVNSPEAALNVAAGPQEFDGATALAWARARKMDFTNSADRRAFEKVYGANGDDRNRIERQQELLGKVFEVAMAKDLFRDFEELTDMLQAIADSMTASPNIAQFEFIVGLAWNLRHIDSANVVFATVPTEWHPNGNNLVWTDEAYTLFQQIVDDAPITGTSVTDLSDAGAVPAPAPTPSTGSRPSPSGSPSPTPAATFDLLGACAP